MTLRPRPLRPGRCFVTISDMTASPLLPCIAIAGPTASGKTAGAMALAAVLGARGQAVEIISVDSALVYRGMDIGTAKPSAAEQAAVPHHLIDIRDPLQAYSAAEFVQDAQRLIDEIRARGALPLLVGGTMLYFKALFDGIDDMPAADAAVRAQLEERAARIGWHGMHAELAQVDPETAARLAPGDSQRIQRALEVFMISGQPLSHFHTRARTTSAGTENAPAIATLFSLMRALPSASTPCSMPAWWPKSRACARAAICMPNCHRCAAWAIARSGTRWTGRRGAAANSTAICCVKKALPRRASWQSARSPGCAACPGAR